MISETPLDNPVWSTLVDTHANYCINYGNVKFFKPDYAPFGAFTNIEDTKNAIIQHAKILDEFFIVGDKPLLPNGFKIKKYVGLQMVAYNLIKQPISENIIQLNTIHHNDLLTLIKIAYPHFFKNKTDVLGRYFGIYKNKQLVAITGERMQTNNFTEISAVVTHPEHTGNGYAKQLITHTAKKIIKSKKIPFLHVDENNVGPINLYKKLGFTERRKMHYWLISRA